MSSIQYSQGDLVIMALTCWGEARNESQAGIAAVAWSIRNRVEADLHDDNKPDWWGEGVAAVCLKPSQYSCWNEGDPNREKILDMLTGRDPASGSLNARGLENAALARCLRVAHGVLEGEIADPTGGATHYFADYISLPSWARGKEPSAVYGVHRFFSDIEPGYTPKGRQKGKARPARVIGLPPNQAAPASVEPEFSRLAIVSQIARVEAELRELRRMVGTG